MSQPILSIKESESVVRATANLLPCRVHHDGPIDPASSYWTPTTATDGSKSAHFRGRKLAGKTVKLPEQCRGVVVEKREEKAAEPQVTDEYADADPEAQSESFGTIQVTAEFDEMVVWGHEMMADAASDPYVRSMEEWLQVSDKIHSYS